jgi:hypothetical protein
MVRVGRLVVAMTAMVGLLVVTSVAVRLELALACSPERASVGGRAAGSGGEVD